MKNIVIWIIVVIVIIAGTFWYVNRSAEAPTLQEEEVSRSIVIGLSPQNNSNMSGTAIFTDTNGSTHVEISLTGAPSGVDQPAHIHTGSCDDIGGIIYPLESPLNGNSETTLNVSLDDILGQLPLALNVHKSVEESQIFVACGDLM